MIPKWRNKLIGIFYHGCYGDYKCKGSSSKDNASLEFGRRKNLIELSEKNPDAFKQIVKNNLHLFHGTNSNALPGIIKYGLLSEHELKKEDNPIVTGERNTRLANQSRSFISFTDQIDVALKYSKIPPSAEAKYSSFGIILGISEDDIKDLETFKVPSDFPELGIIGNLPPAKIKTIFAPEDKMEYISRLLSGTNIELASLDSLMPEVEKIEYDYKNMEELIASRNTSGIKRIMSKVKKFIKDKYNKKEKDEEKQLWQKQKILI